MIVNIIKGNIKNAVDEKQFEKLYKPNGWVLDETIIAQDEVKNIIKTLNTETDVKNFIKMTSKQKKKFDDKLFYGDVLNEKKEGDENVKI